MKNVITSLAVVAITFALTGAAYAGSSNHRGAFNAIKAHQTLQSNRSAYALTGEHVVRQRMQYQNKRNIGGRGAH